MNRRTFLAVTGVGITGLAGCSSSGTDDNPTTTRTATGTESPTQAGSPTRTVNEELGTVAGVPLPVPEDQLARGAGKDAIPAITDTAFAADWSGLEIEVRDPYTGDETTIKPRLEDDDRVVGVVRNGEARAYPLRILNWHEVVNDTFDGPLLVTFCPLCGSGITAERRVDGTETTFGVSGLLWNSDLVMYDELTESLWSQIAATAIRGPAVGAELTLVPSTITTWGPWREEHPDTRVLLPPPKSSTVVGDVTRNYNTNPYVSYESSSRVGIGNNDFDDDRLHPKALVIGVRNDGKARAYPLETLREERVVNDEIGGLPVVVAVGPDDQTLVAYERTVEGTTLEFEPASDPRFMRGGGSRWRILPGEAVDGSYEGTELVSASPEGKMFWFAWVDFTEETDVYGQSG